VVEGASPLVADPEIARERAFLATAREALARMHVDVVNTQTPLVDSEDSDEIWHNTVYQLARTRRAQALVDLPEVPLFFGRLDADASGERVYIGRRHVRDADGTPLVIDWRAAMSVPFYRATRGDPQGVRSRRRYGFSDTAELTAYEDEPLTGPAAAAAGSRGNALLTAEIERPRSGPMRDIVATIQPEQDELVRAPLHPTVCVQGAPGTGKTAIGLHRLAYLLYTEPDKLRGGVAIVGPNRSFLGYIRHVLPALGEVNVAQTTIEELIGRRGGGVDDPEVARIKGDARMASVLRRALWAHVGEPAHGLVYAKGAYRYRLSPEVVREVVASLREANRYKAARAALAQRLAHLVLVQMERRGEAPDDRVQSAVARSRPVTQLVAAVWPLPSPEQVLFRLLSQPDFLADAAAGDLTSAEQAQLSWEKPGRSAKSARWTVADAALLDELADLLDRTPSLRHIMVDEAQDLSPMQCRALARRSVNGSLTVLGDVAQATSPGATGDWPALLEHLGAPDARLAVLNHGFRVPAEILDYAARLLPHISPALAAPVSVRHVPGALQVTKTGPAELRPVVATACGAKLLGGGSVGLIAADADIGAFHQFLLGAGLEAALLGEDANAMDGARLVCVPAALAKGLEFDTVVVAEPARIVAAESRGRLYVVLTRAVSSMHVVHAEPLPPALAG
jgi:DNA helicase IV